MTFIQRHLTSMQRHDVEATLYKRHVPAGGGGDLLKERSGATYFLLE